MVKIGVSNGQTGVLSRGGARPAGGLLGAASAGRHFAGVDPLSLGCLTTGQLVFLMYLIWGGLGLV